MTDTIPRLESRPGGINIFYKGKYLYHEQSPEEHTRIRAFSVTLPGKSIILLPSPLLGYGIKDLLERLPDSSHLVCLEKDQLLMDITVRTFLHQSLKDPRVSFVRTDSVPALIEYLEKKIDWKRYRKVLLIPLNRGYILYRSFYDEVQKQLLMYLERIHRNRLTTIRLGKRWMSNLFQNLIHLPEAIPLSDLSIRKPPLLLGAGESLEDRFEWIEQVRESVYLIAVDTVLPILSALGVRPDLVVSVDAQAINLQDFLAFPYVGIPLAADLTVYPGILRNWKGPLYLFLSRFESLRWFEDPETYSVLPPLLPPLGSVGNTALYLACTYADASLPVLCLGMDFCYTPGKPHARGAYTHQLYVARHTRLNPSPLLENSMHRQKTTVLSVNGKAVKADPVLQSFLEVARTVCQNEKRTYNLSNRGLDFGASTVEDFCALTSILQLPYPDFRPTISSSSLKSTDQMFSSNPSLLRQPWSAPQIKDFVERLAQNLEEVGDWMEKALSCASTQFTLEENLYPMLESLDFLFLDLPDPPSPDTFDFPKALQISSNIGRYKRILCNVLHALNLRKS